MPFFGMELMVLILSTADEISKRLCAIRAQQLKDRSEPKNQIQTFTLCLINQDKKQLRSLLHRNAKSQIWMLIWLKIWTYCCPIAQEIIARTFFCPSLRQISQCTRGFDEMYLVGPVRFGLAAPDPIPIESIHCLGPDLMANPISRILKMVTS